MEEMPVIYFKSNEEISKLGKWGRIHIYGSMLVILGATASYNSLQHAEKQTEDQELNSEDFMSSKKEDKIDSLRNKNSIVFLLEAYYTQIWH